MTISKTQYVYLSIKGILELGISTVGLFIGFLQSFIYLPFIHHEGVSKKLTIIIVTKINFLENVNFSYSFFTFLAYGVAFV